jgi:hypothetical protein
MGLSALGAQHWLGRATSILVRLNYAMFAETSCLLLDRLHFLGIPTLLLVCLEARCVECCNTKSDA